MTLFGRWTEGGPGGVVSWGNVLIRGEGGRITFIDYTVPDSPVETYRMDVPVHPAELQRDGNLLIARDIYYGAEFPIFDLDVTGYPLVGYITRPEGVDAWTVRDQRLVLALRDVAPGDSKLVLYDLANPATPVAHDLGLDIPVSGIALFGDYLFVQSNSSLLRYDVSDPDNVVEAGNLVMPYNPYQPALMATDALLLIYSHNNNSIHRLDTIDPTSPANPSFLGAATWSATSDAYRHYLDVDSDLAYCVSDEGEVQIVDLHDPALPALRGFYAYNRVKSAGAVASRLVLGLDYGNGFQVIDASDPDSPVLEEEIATGLSSYGVEASESRAYVYQHEDYIEILDLSDPATPASIGTIEIGGEVWGFAADGDLLVVSSDAAAVQVFDCSDPAAPDLLFTDGTGSYDGRVSVVDHVAILSGGQGIMTVSLTDPIGVLGLVDIDRYHGDFCAIAGHAYGVGEAGLDVIDLSDLASPSLVTTIPLALVGYGIAVASGRLYVSSAQEYPDDPDLPNVLEIFDLADPAAPVLLGSGSLPAHAGQSWQTGRSLCAVGDYVFVGNVEDGLLAYDVSDPASPQEFGFFNTGDNLRSLAWSRGFLLAADWQDGVYVLRPEFPVHVDDDTGMLPGVEPLVRVYPNPFNPRTTISFTIRSEAQVQLSVVDLRGRRVATLFDGHVAAGEHAVTWDGCDLEGRLVPSGVYFSRLEADGRIVHERMTLVR